MDPVTVSTAIADAKNFLSGIFGNWGEGRREADVIVPVQEAIYNQLVSINRQVDDVEDPNVLYTWLEYLQQWRSQFITFVEDPAFTDGRASQQALNDLIPVIDGTIRTVNGQLSIIGYETGVPSGPGPVRAGAGMDMGTMLLLGAGAAFLLRK